MFSTNPMDSLATGQISFGPGNPEFPLYPSHLAGCPVTSTAEMQYPLELTFDYEKVKGLGVTESSRQNWQQLMPPLHPASSMPVGNTPLIDISAIAPSPLRDRGVFIKDESRNPTWSHKDRLNKYTISAALLENASTIIVASSGNHGVSAAAMASRAGLNCIVITMPDVSPAFRDMIIDYGAFPVFLEVDARWPAMRALREVPGMYPVSNLTSVHTGHPWGTEGYKTIAYEIVEAFGGKPPAAVVVPTGYGEMLYGIYKGFREARDLGLTGSIPQLVSAEPAARGPLYYAITSGKQAATVKGLPTIQGGTASTVSGYRAAVAIQKSEGIPLVVTDEAALTAHAKLARQGIWQEYSSSAAFAALSDIESLSQEGPVVVMNCSTGLKEPRKTMSVKEARPDLPSLRAYLKSEFNFNL